MASLRAQIRNPISNRNTLLLQGIADQVRDEACSGYSSLFLYFYSGNKKNRIFAIKYDNIRYQK